MDLRLIGLSLQDVLDKIVLFHHTSLYQEQKSKPKIANKVRMLKEFVYLKMKLK